MKKFLSFMLALIVASGAVVMPPVSVEASPVVEIPPPVPPVPSVAAEIPVSEDVPQGRPALQEHRDNTWFEAVYATWEGRPEDEFTAQISMEQDGVQVGRWQRVDSELVRYMGDGTWRVDVPGLSADFTYNLTVDFLHGSEVVSLHNLQPRAFDRQGYAFYRTERFPNGTVGGHNPDGTPHTDAQIIYVTHETRDRLAGLSFRDRPTIVRIIGRVGRIGDLPSGANFQHMMPILNADNITIEGVGPDAVIEGFGLLLAESSNVIVRNLTFEHTRHDSVWLRGPASHAWILHNTFFISGDGSSDVGSGATNFTIAYNQYIGTIQTMLANGNPGEAMHRGTWHHNWFFHSDARHPRLRATQAHVFNNLYDHAGHGIAAGERASVFAEGNIFINTGTGAGFTGRGAEAPMGMTGQGIGGGIAGAEGPGFIVTSETPPELLAGFENFVRKINLMRPNSFDAASRERFDPALDNGVMPDPSNNSGERNIGGITVNTHDFRFTPFDPWGDLDSPVLGTAPRDWLNPVPAELAEIQVRNDSGTMRWTGAAPLPDGFDPQTHIQQPVISHLNINGDGSVTVRTARSPWATEYIFEWNRGGRRWETFEDTPNPNNAYTFTTPAGFASPGETYNFMVTAVNARTGQSLASAPASITYHAAPEYGAVTRDGLENRIYTQNFDTFSPGAPGSYFRRTGAQRRMSLWTLRFPYMFPDASGLEMLSGRPTVDDDFPSADADGFMVMPNTELSTSLYPNPRRNYAVITDNMNVQLDATFGLNEAHHLSSPQIAGITTVSVPGNALLLRDWNHNNHSDQERYGTVMQLDLGSEQRYRVRISYDFLLNRSAASAGSGFFPIRLYDQNRRMIMARRDNTTTEVRHNHFDPGLNLAYPTWEEHTNRWINLEVILDFSERIFDIYLDGELYEAGVPIPRGVSGVRYIVASTPTGNHGSQTMNMLVDNFVVAIG